MKKTYGWGFRGRGFNRGLQYVHSMQFVLSLYTVCTKFVHSLYISQSWKSYNLKKAANLKKALGLAGRPAGRRLFSRFCRLSQPCPRDPRPIFVSLDLFFSFCLCRLLETDKNLKTGIAWKSELDLEQKSLNWNWNREAWKLKWEHLLENTKFLSKRTNTEIKNTFLCN